MTQPCDQERYDIIMELVGALDIDYDEKRASFATRRGDTYQEGYLDGIEFAMNKLSRVAMALTEEPNG